MRIIGLILSLTLALTVQSQAGYKGAVALVPGTFNSFTLGHYFSKTIVSTLEKEGFAVKVVGGLSGIGEFQVNGDITLKSVRKWYQEKFPKSDVPLTFIGHSAGGFYALYAATLGHDLPIKNIILMSTPLEGSKLAERVVPDFITYFDGKIFDLRGLEQIKPANVRKFLQDVRVPDKVNVYASGSSQNIPGFFDNRLNSKYLSIPLSITAAIIGEESDGIVERSSVYSRTSDILTESGEELNIQSLEYMHGNLDHVEQVLNANVFLLTLTTNIRFIEQEQKRMFTEFAHLISGDR